MLDSKFTLAKPRLGRYASARRYMTITQTLAETLAEILAEILAETLAETISAIDS